MRSLFGELRGCDSEALRRNRFLEVGGVRSLFGELRGVRLLFGELRGCDSEALRRNRCLGG